MTDYLVTQVYPSDKRSNLKINELLAAEGISRDKNLDYTCAVFDDDMNVIATGSCFGNTLRCLAISRAYQGEGIMNSIVTHLMEVQLSRGNTHLFLYTKCESAKFFASLGFYEIVRIDNQLVFMENRRAGFASYLAELSKDAVRAPKTAALVINANPFTLGHQYLVEKACAENDLVHLFIVSEDASLVPFNVRKKLIIEGTTQFSNLRYHDSGSYMISTATFPSYFLKDEQAVIEGHALLDLSIFVSIAKSLYINRRYVGEGPTSLVTGIYNDIMIRELPKNGIACFVIPRKTYNAMPISASTVRTAIKNQDFDTLKLLVPDTTYQFFCSEEAAPIIRKIQNEKNVVHY